jgi:hypothetical protein
MSSWVGAIFLVVGLIVLIRLFRLVERSGEVVAISRRSWKVMRDPTLSDDAKEKSLQTGAKQLLPLLLILAFGGAGAVLLPLAAVWVGDRLDWISLEATLAVTISPVFLIGSGALACVALLIPHKKAPTATSYSALDRCMHRVAFATYGTQTLIADLEDRLFARQLAALQADRPVFVTGLPRAGTTMLLEILARLPDFAAHTYREMPFVLIPCLWSRFSRGFQRSGLSRERAHGDGMLIDFDSPEALEELLWTTFWPRHYQSDRIVPWQEDEREDEFEEFFRNHMRKIILLRRGEHAHEARYISKNNLNISRTQTLRRLFPDSLTVVPFRHPLHHAASLLQQHRNFLSIHDEDPFACTYMRAIGHFDFGKNLRPIDFDGWVDSRRSHDSQSLAFWLEYWIVTYKYLLTQNGDLHFVSYDAMCDDPDAGLRRLAEAIGIGHGKALATTGITVRAPRPRDVDISSINSTLVEEADLIHRSLMDAAACETDSEGRFG